MKINRIINFYDQGVEIPSKLKTALLYLFDVDNIDDFFQKTLLNYEKFLKCFAVGVRPTMPIWLKNMRFIIYQ